MAYDNKDIKKAKDEIIGSLIHTSDEVKAAVDSVEINTMNLESRLDDIIALLKSIEKKL